MKTNIFLNAYQQAENKLTYNFLAILELLNDKGLCEFLTGLALSEKPVAEIKTVYGGGESNPDGSFNLKKQNGDIITVFFENKTKRRGLSVQQIVSHLNWCKGDDLLLVVTPRNSDIDIIRSLQNDKVKFFTWSEVAVRLKSLESEIANQFIEYGRLSGEFEELGEIHRDDIAIYCKFLKTNFDNKLNNILDNFHHQIDLRNYSFSTKKRKNSQWGRIGTEFINGDYESVDFEKYRFGQFWAISYYHNTYDHRIPFKIDLPEIAFFFDINPKRKSAIQMDDDFMAIMDSLKALGFESNLNNELSPNPWRLFCYRKPISDFQELSVLSLLNFCDEVMQKILSTKALSHPYFSEMQSGI
jgi:hypothetical protein